ncbi:D-xylose transporter subunit XylF, partial [bacterium M21]
GVLSVALFTGCGKSGKNGDTAASGKPDVLIGFSLADLKQERWKRDRDMFTAKAEELGGKVLIKDAGGSAQTQIEQCRNLLLQGIKVLVIVPKNADAAAPIIKEAHAKGVKVLSYDRLITNAPTDLYISFNNFRVGEIQAEEILKAVPKGTYLLLGGDPADKNADMLRKGQLKILKPAIDKGDIKVVADPFCDKWKRQEAKRYTEDTLAKYPELKAIVASNDGTAGGAIAALQAKGMAGKVPVSGQDADLEACQNVVKGTQTVTVYKPIRQIAEASAAIAVELASGADVKAACGKITDGTQLTVNNGHSDIPTIFLTPIPVTKANIDATVIKDGYHTKEAVYGKK